MDNNSVRVLLVDDDEDDYVMTRDLLSEIEEVKYALEWASTYDAALEAIGHNHHDVYLLDYRLGERTGLELLQEAVRNGCKGPMILLTGQGDHGVDIEAMKAGAADYLVKGKSDSSLLERSMRYAIERKRAYEEKERLMKKIEAINTDLLALNQEMETVVAERTMSLMALTVADRVRNPAAIVGCICKRVLEKEEISDKLRRSLKDIIDESEKLETIVKDFQNLLKNRRSRFGYEDINGIVESVMSVIEKETAHKGVELVANLSEQPLKINTPKDLLRVAVFHVMENAVEATPEGGRITVATSEDRGSVALTISDTGCGIPKEDIDKIFDSFYSTKKHKFGMGLSLIKQIVSEHLGEIMVESELGKGTTFKIIFPVRWMEKQIKQPIVKDKRKSPLTPLLQRGG